MAVVADPSLAARVAAFFSSDPQAIADPWPLYAELRSLGRTFDAGHLVIVSHYDDVRAIARDGIRFSNAYRERGPRSEAVRAALPEEARPAFEEVRDFEANELSRTDGARHDRLRQVAHRVFTPRRIAALQPAADRYVGELLDELAEDDVADLKRLAYQVPLQIITDLLDVPPGDRDLIHEWSNTLGRNRGGTELEPLLAARDALREFRGYVHDMIDRHRTAPADTDLLAALMTADRGEQLTEDELAAMFVQLLFAGHETTTNLIAIGTLELLRHPEQWRRLTADPGLVEDAVEELLRYVSPVQYGARLVLEDVTVGDDTIPAGKTAVLAWASANRDPAAFADADTLDLTRANARNHLGFGFGPHFCLGSALARLEGVTAFRALATRFPDTELAVEPDGLAWKGNAMLRTPVVLPVRLR